MPRLPRLALGELVAIQWEDAWADDEAVVELGREHPQRPYLIWVAGYVTLTDKMGVLVAREKLADGRYRSVQYVPKSYIRQIRKLDEEPASLMGEAYIVRDGHNES